MLLSAALAAAALAAAATAEAAAPEAPFGASAAGAATAACAAVLAPECLLGCACSGGGICCQARARLARSSGVGGGAGGSSGAAVAPAAPPSPCPAVAQHPPLPLPRAQVATSPNDAFVLVGGRDVSGEPMPLGLLKRQRGQRGGDTAKRKPKSCKLCKKWGGAECATAYTCNGRAPRGSCQHYTADGPP